MIRYIIVYDAVFDLDLYGASYWMMLYSCSRFQHTEMYYIDGYWRTLLVLSLLSWPFAGGFKMN